MLFHNIVRVWYMPSSTVILMQCIVYIRGMVAMLPKVHRPDLPPIPVAGDIRADLNNKAAKWRWVTDAAYLTEEAISKWIHTNLARMNM